VQIPPQPQPEASVPAWEAILVIVVTFFLTLFIGGSILFLGGDLGEGITLIFGEVLILLIPLIYLVSKRIHIRTYVKIDPKPTQLLLGAAAGGLVFLLGLVVDNLLVYVLGNSEAVQQSNTTIVNFSASAGGLAVVATSLILAGVCEEFAFRGFFQNALTRHFEKSSRKPKYAYIPAIVIAAAAFGIFHFDPQGVYTISAFISGLALGYIYYKSGNYVVAATAHATVNVIVLVLLMAGF
jgi:uncharacterized protein